MNLFDMADFNAAQAGAALRESESTPSGTAPMNPSMDYYLSLIHISEPTRPIG